MTSPASFWCGEAQGVITMSVALTVLIVISTDASQGNSETNVGPYQ